MLGAVTETARRAYWPIIGTWRRNVVGPGRGLWSFGSLALPGSGAPYAPSSFLRQFLGQRSDRTSRDEIVNPTAEAGDFFYDS
jgi:hypothetical protein